jgi:hypothetical protein
MRITAEIIYGIGTSAIMFVVSLVGVYFARWQDWLGYDNHSNSGAVLTRPVIASTYC